MFLTCSEASNVVINCVRSKAKGLKISRRGGSRQRNTLRVLVILKFYKPVSFDQEL